MHFFCLISLTKSLPYIFQWLLNIPYLLRVVAGMASPQKNDTLFTFVFKRDIIITILDQYEITLTSADFRVTKSARITVFDYQFLCWKTTHCHFSCVAPSSSNHNQIEVLKDKRKTTLFNKVVTSVQNFQSICTTVSLQ